MQSFLRAVKGSTKTYVENLVREATKNEPNAATTSQLMQLANYTFSKEGKEYEELKETLFKRLTHYDCPQHIFKSLVVTRYLVLNGDPRFINDLKKLPHLHELMEYHFYDEDREIGHEIRVAADGIIKLLTDNEHLRVERAKARETVRKIIGFSAQDMYERTSFGAQKPNNPVSQTAIQEPEQPHAEEEEDRTTFQVVGLDQHQDNHANQHGFEGCEGFVHTYGNVKVDANNTSSQTPNKVQGIPERPSGPLFVTRATNPTHSVSQSQTNTNDPFALLGLPFVEENNSYMSGDSGHNSQSVVVDFSLVKDAPKTAPSPNQRPSSVSSQARPGSAASYTRHTTRGQRKSVTEAPQIVQQIQQTPPQQQQDLIGNSGEWNVAQPQRPSSAVRQGSASPVDHFAQLQLQANSSPTQQPPAEFDPFAHLF